MSDVSAGSKPRGLQGRIALVTGAAGAGIGQATARRLLRDGATVIVTDIHEARTAKVAESLQGEGSKVYGFPMDAGDRVAIDATIATVRKTVGPIDVLINNAAINPVGPVAEMTTEDWDRALDVDLSGPWYLMRSVIPHMLETGRGDVVNVTSVAGFVGTMQEGPYAAAKAALHCLTRTAAGELGPSGIRVNCVAPGLVWSKFMERYEAQFRPEIERTPLRRWGQPEDVADVISFLVSDDARFITGETLTVSGGWYMRP